MNGMDGLEVDPAELDCLEKVGSGCTAEVYRGTFRTVEVAIKIIEWNKSQMNPKHQIAFDREVSIMAKVDCEYLVKLLAVCSMQAPFRIITEFCSGGCCFELLHNNDHIELVWSQQLKISKDTAQAMEYLHGYSPQIIHRDLKSLNLLLAKPVESSSDVPLVKVSDFGMARMKDHAPDSDWGKMTIAAGTCHWMAPEVFSGTSYDVKVDVYSFSMIMFEVICREIPFEDEEPAKVGGMAIKGERPDLEAIPPDCPEEFSNLMIRCWAHNPAERPSFPDIVESLLQVESVISSA